MPRTDAPEISIWLAVPERPLDRPSSYAKPGLDGRLACASLNNMQSSIHPHHIQRDRRDRSDLTLGRPRFEPLLAGDAEQAVELLARLIAAAARGREDQDGRLADGGRVSGGQRDKDAGRRRSRVANRLHVRLASSAG